MTAPRSPDALALAGERAALALLNSPRLTRPQREYASSTVRKLLWRGGNSIGKSQVHAWDDIHFLRGTNPFRVTPRPPVEILIAGYSYAQMDPLLKKLWSMLPKDEIDPKLYYAPGQGIRGFKEPVIPFIAGPGRGSVAYIVTYEQGADRIMGFQGHRLSFDEPPPGGIYAEAIPRLNRYRGELRITMTPTPESPPLEYLREEVEKRKIVEMQTSYCREAITVLGGLVPWAWKTDAEIEEDLLGYLSDERPMREHGAWEAVVKGRWLEFVTDACFTESALPGFGTWRLCIGIGHGARPGRQSATLVAHNPDTGEVWLVDEAGEEGVPTTTREDARNILAMLKRNDIDWREVDFWEGDRATSESYWGAAKSNEDLAGELAREVGLARRQAATQGLRIQTARNRPGSPRRGVAMINTLARKDRLRVRTACKRFDKARREWKGQASSEMKDGVDSARYAVTRLVDQGSAAPEGDGQYQ